MSEKTYYYSDFCRGKECEHFIQWDFGYGDCYSCKKIGQSHEVYKYPDDCPFIEEIKLITLDSEEIKE